MGWRADAGEWIAGLPVVKRFFKSAADEVLLNSEIKKKAAAEAAKALEEFQKTAAAAEEAAKKAREAADLLAKSNAKRAEKVAAEKTAADAEAAAAKAAQDAQAAETAATTAAQEAKATADRVVQDSGTFQKIENRVKRLLGPESTKALIKRVDNKAVSVADTTQDAKDAMDAAKSAAKGAIIDGKDKVAKKALAAAGKTELGVQRGDEISAGLKTAANDLELALTSGTPEEISKARKVAAAAIKDAEKAEKKIGNAASAADTAAYNAEHGRLFRMMNFGFHNPKTVVAGVVGYEALHLAHEGDAPAPEVGADGKPINGKPADAATTTENIVHGIADNGLVKTATGIAKGLGWKDPELWRTQAAAASNGNAPIKDRTKEMVNGWGNYFSQEGLEKMGMWGWLAGIISLMFEGTLKPILDKVGDFLGGIIEQVTGFFKDKIVQFMDKNAGDNKDLDPAGSPTVPAKDGPGVAAAPPAAGQTNASLTTGAPAPGATTTVAGDPPAVATMRAKIVETQKFLKDNNRYAGDTKGVVTPDFTRSVQQYLKDEFGKNFGGPMIYSGPVSGRVDSHLVYALTYLCEHPDKTKELQKKNPEFVAALPSIINAMQNREMLAALEQPPAQAAPAPTVVASAPPAKAPDAAPAQAPAADPNIKPASLVVPDTQTATAPAPDTTKKPAAAKPAEVPFGWVDGAFLGAQVAGSWIPVAGGVWDAAVAGVKYGVDRELRDMPAEQANKELAANMAVAGVAALPIPGLGEAAAAAKLAVGAGKLGAEAGAGVLGEKGYDMASSAISGGVDVPDTTTQTPGKTPAPQQNVPVTPDQQLSA